MKQQITKRITKEISVEYRHGDCGAPALFINDVEVLRIEEDGEVWRVWIQPDDIPKLEGLTLEERPNRNGFGRHHYIKIRP